MLSHLSPLFRGERSEPKRKRRLRMRGKALRRKDHDPLGSSFVSRHTDPQSYLLFKLTA
jgi:hypothetical protein